MGRPEPVASSHTSNRLIRQLCARMSLRKPQERSLEILADVVGAHSLPSSDLPAALEAVRQLAKGDVRSVEAFERDFVSLCFALATGVGKTRLMGAFITYLYLARTAGTGKPYSRNFFVLAPNTTIYEKLINDFTPGKPKYVFKGIAEFAQNPPLIVTRVAGYAGRANCSTPTSSSTSSMSIRSTGTSAAFEAPTT
jgi:type III restriction enzyme